MNTALHRASLWVSCNDHQLEPSLYSCHCSTHLGSTHIGSAYDIIILSTCSKHAAAAAVVTKLADVSDCSSLTCMTHALNTSCFTHINSRTIKPRRSFSTIRLAVVHRPITTFLFQWTFQHENLHTLKPWSLSPRYNAPAYCGCDNWCPEAGLS